MLNGTQKSWVEDKLLAFGKVTRNECLRNYISRLGAIIAILKEDGWEFETDYVEVNTPFGKGKDYQYKVTTYPKALKDKLDLMSASDVIEDMDNIKKEDIQVNMLSFNECYFCESSNVEIAKTPCYQRNQIDTWFVRCECGARGGKGKSQQEALNIWNRADTHDENTESLFMVDFVAIVDNAYPEYTGESRYKFKAENREEARHWVINHLDCSCSWIVEVA